MVPPVRVANLARVGSCPTYAGFFSVWAITEDEMARYELPARLRGDYLRALDDPDLLSHKFSIEMLGKVIPNLPEDSKQRREAEKLKQKLEKMQEKQDKAEAKVRKAMANVAKKLREQSKK
jgi:hypothetical protein